MSACHGNNLALRPESGCTSGRSGRIGMLNFLASMLPFASVRYVGGTILMPISSSCAHFTSVRYIRGDRMRLRVVAGFLIWRPG